MSLHLNIFLCTLAMPVLAACSGGVVTTDGGTTPESAQSPGTPTPTPRASNANLVNAFDFYGESDDHPGYFFTTPSGAWRCLITAHEQAGCQSAKTAARLGITGVPDTVTDAAGTSVTPNALVIKSTGGSYFTKVDAEEFKLIPGPAHTLQFGKILAAAGFRCNVQDLGISCLSEDSGQGFTFSADGYTPSYTDLPATS